jgi:hypothetical protein
VRGSLHLAGPVVFGAWLLVAAAAVGADPPPRALSDAPPNFSAPLTQPNAVAPVPIAPDDESTPLWSTSGGSASHARYEPRPDTRLPVPPVRRAFRAEAAAIVVAGAARHFDRARPSDGLHEPVCQTLGRWCLAHATSTSPA